jgi:hypothetical protein
MPSILTSGQFELLAEPSWRLPKRLDECVERDEQQSLEMTDFRKERASLEETELRKGRTQEGGP